jgi:hypothetical protein
MIEAHDALEVSPKSLFGRYPYPHEQSLIRNFTKEVDESVIFVSPSTVAVPIPLQHLPADFRRRKIKEHLTRAREILNDLIP